MNVVYHAEMAINLSDGGIGFGWYTLSKLQLVELQTVVLKRSFTAS